MRFTKMQGAGNDYIYLNGFNRLPSHLNELSQKMSDRHFGVGSDGLVVILPSENCDFRMRMFNSDGTEAEMCGNASRCVGKYVYENGLTSKTELTLETLAGVKHLKLHIHEGKVHQVSVDIPVESGRVLSREGFGVSPDSVRLFQKRRGEGAGRTDSGVD